MHENVLMNVRNSPDLFAVFYLHFSFRENPEKIIKIFLLFFHQLLRVSTFFTLHKMECISNTK